MGRGSRLSPVLYVNNGWFINPAEKRILMQTGLREHNIFRILFLLQSYNMQSPKKAATPTPYRIIFRPCISLCTPNMNSGSSSGSHYAILLPVKNPR